MNEVEEVWEDEEIGEVSIKKKSVRERIAQREKKPMIIAGSFALILLLMAAALFSGTFVWLKRDGSKEDTSIHSRYSSVAHSIVEFTRDQSHVYFQHLTDFTDIYPARICGSDNLEGGINWMKELWETSNFDNVYLQPVSGIPNWIRNEGTLQLIEPKIEDMPMLALGNSIPTPDEGIEAEVIVVSDFDELEEKKDLVNGKIVLYNCIFTTYSETVVYRVQGAIEAAKYGAVASLVRSITPFSLQTPHTGVMRYEDGITKIPHAAITLEYADYLQRLQDAGTIIRVKLFMSCETGPLKDSFNIIAEIEGSEYPEQVVVMGGHIDSWDVGRGAMDDGGGVMAAYFALDTIKNLGLVPKRTIRIIAWVDEENTGRGETTYYESQSNEQLDNHMIGIESDIGVFTPSAYSHTSDATPGQIAMMQDIVDLMGELGNGTIDLVEGEGGADTSSLYEYAGVPVSELYTDSSIYFYYHHSVADTIDKLNSYDFGDCAASLGILSYIIADSDENFREL